jgi:hypothetical protein
VGDGADTGAVRAIGADIARALTARRIPAEVLDQAACGIDAVDARVERLVGFVAATLARHGVATVVALGADARAVRERARAAIPRMIEVWVRATAAPAYEAPERAEVEVAFPEPIPGGDGPDAAHARGPRLPAADARRRVTRTRKSAR